MKRRMRIILVIGLIIILVWIGLIFWSDGRRFVPYEARFVPDTVDVEYLKLFSSKSYANLEPKGAYIFSTRSPIAQFLLFGKYSLLVTKIDSARCDLFPNCVKLVNADLEIENSLFNDANQELYNFKNRIYPPKSSAMMTLNYEGDLVSLVSKNGGLIHYFLRFKSFSIQYEENQSPDFAGNARGELVSMDFYLIRQAGSLYLVLATDSKGGVRSSGVRIDSIFNETGK